LSDPGTSNSRKRRIASAVLAAVFAHGFWERRSTADDSGDAAPLAAAAPEETLESEAPYRLHFVPMGLASYFPETSGLFAAVGYVYGKLGEDPGLRNSSATLVAAYTLRKQLILSASSNLFLLENRLFVTSELTFLHFPNYFYGIGNNTRLSSQEDFDSRSLLARVRPMFSVADHAYIGPALQMTQLDMLSTKPGGLLATGGVLGAGGGRDLALGLSMRYDTRDIPTSASRGVFLQADALFSSKATGSDYNFQSYTFDFREFFPTWHDQVLALQEYAKLENGSPPFFMLAQLGGLSLLRGHYQGRYSDKDLLAAQAEYRVPLFWRIGAVAFAGLGEVAPNLGAFRADALKFSLGGGLRIMLDKKSRVNLRLDGAWGGDEHGFYFSIDEAF